MATPARDLSKMRQFVRGIQENLRCRVFTRPRASIHIRIVLDRERPPSAWRGEFGETS